MNTTIIVSEDEQDRYQVNHSRASSVASSVEFVVQHRVAPILSASSPLFRTGASSAPKTGRKKAIKKDAEVVASSRRNSAAKGRGKQEPSSAATREPEVISGFDSETMEEDGFEVTGRKRGAGSLEYPDTELWSYDPNETEEDVLRSVSRYSSAAHQWPPLAAVSSSSPASTPTKRSRITAPRSAPTTPSKAKRQRQQTMGFTPLVGSSRARTAPNTPHRGGAKSKPAPPPEGGGETDAESEGFEIVMAFDMLGDASSREASLMAEGLQAAGRENEGSSRAAIETAPSGSRANVDRKMITWY